jgi:hyperosmotically inducible periplasmic protein
MQARWIRETALISALGMAPAMNLAAQDKPVRTDNTAANKEIGQTADQQKETKEDRFLSQQIRKAVVSDKSLSTYAHNIKIISQNGTVTLRGPVRSEDERAAIEAKAKEVAGVTAVTDELTIAPKQEKK